MQSVVMLLIGNIRTDGRVQKEILTLRSRGFSVTLIQWPYRGESGGHEHLGIDIIDYPRRLHRSAAVNFIRQILFNFFAIRHLKRLKPQFVQCNDLNTLLAGFLFRHRARVIYDAHELFPESQDGIRRRVWSWLERRMAPACHGYIQPEKNRLTYFAEKYNIDPARVALVENFPSGDYAFSGRSRLREYFDLDPARVILLCTGVFGPGRDIENMITCMSLLDDRFILVLLGPIFKGYDRELTARVSEAKIEDRVRFHPEIPNIEMLDYMQSCDIGLVFYRNTDLNNYWCASNKLYEFILCGKPVITNSYPGLREVVEEHRLGACIPEVSPASLAAAVLGIVDGEQQPLAASPYIWENQESSYLQLFAHKLERDGVEPVMITDEFQRGRPTGLPGHV